MALCANLNAIEKLVRGMATLMNLHNKKQTFFRLVM
ncbi:MAG: hypothetical protein ACD_67C00208G0001 [uncultured bacterium]|nr:MAG: hypothetical protein ACD_67C00208G0001 [uncultured bacterium]